jgi:hypothetical protein
MERLVWDDPVWIAAELDCLLGRGEALRLARLLDIAMLEARAAELAAAGAGVVCPRRYVR